MRVYEHRLRCMMRDMNLLPWVCSQAVKEGVGCFHLAFLGKGTLLQSYRLCKMSEFWSRGEP